MPSKYQVPVEASNSQTLALVRISVLQMMRIFLSMYLQQPELVSEGVWVDGVNDRTHYIVDIVRDSC